MKKKRKLNPLLIILGFVVVAVIITVSVVLAKGYRYITYDGAKFLGVAKSGVPYEGKVKYSNGMTAQIDAASQTIKYSNGDVYTGDIYLVFKHGEGEYRFKDTGDIYIGDFSDDKITGYGVYTYADGSSYQGYLVDSKRHGNGLYIAVNGDRYEGNFADNLLEGEGMIQLSDGYTYKGNFVNNVQNGEGECLYPNGDTYKGSFVNNVRHGLGVYVWKNGEEYTGNFINGKRDTRLVDEYGELETNSDGTYVHGEYAVYKWPSGKVYTGYFENDLIKVVDDVDDQ